MASQRMESGIGPEPTLLGRGGMSSPEGNSDMAPTNGDFCS